MLRLISTVKPLDKRDIVQMWSIHLYLFVLTLYCSVIRVSCHYCQNDTLGWPAYKGDEQDCPMYGHRFITIYSQSEVPWDTQGRAWFTIPPEIEIKTSSIPGVGLGAFAKTFIPAHTWLGEYEGEVVKEEYMISPYAWRIYQDDAITHYLDGGHINTSNWLRWVNCARNSSEESVKGLYCKGKVYYYVLKDIYPGKELLVYYGHDYAEDLGIDTSSF